MFSILQQLFAKNRRARNSKNRRRNKRRIAFGFESLERRELLTSYFIDPVRGSDSNPGTTLEAPFRTPRNISYSTAEGNPSYRSLEAGDFVYLRDGVHDWSSLLTIPQTYDEHAAFMIRGIHGTAAAPITIQAYQNEKPIVKARENGVENAAIYILQSENVKVLGLEVTGTFGPGIRVAEASNVEIADNYVHDIDGIHDNNIAGIYTSNTLGLNIHHNLLHDNYDHARAELPGELQRANSRNIVIFGDGSDRVAVHHNKVFNTPRADGRETGEGIWVKHASEIPGASFEFYDNIVRDVQFSAIGSQSANASLHHNLIVNGAPVVSSGGDNISILGPLQAKYNTFVGSRAIEIYGADGLFPSTGLLDFQNNIVVDDEPAYGVDHGIIRLAPYGSDADYRVAVTPQNLLFDGNVYFNPLTSPKWNVFSSDQADDRQPAALGGNLSFSEWQALGVDRHSVVANPQFNASFIPANPSAANAGWLTGDQPRLTMYIGNDLFRESAGVNASSITLVRSKTDLTQSLAVSLRVSDGSEIQVPATATFPKNVGAITVPITALNDRRNEPTRAVQVFGEAMVGTTKLTASEWVRVLQDSVPPPTLPSLAISDVTILEGTSSVGVERRANFTVRLNGQQVGSSSVTVNFATADGTAKAGSDYRATSGTVTVTANQPASVSIPIVSDGAVEPDENFFVRLSNPVNAVIGDGEGIGTIVNDDVYPTIAIADLRIVEGTAPPSGKTSAIFTVTLTTTQATFPSVTVNYGTADGTAKAPTDYATTTGVATLSLDKPTASITIPVTADRNAEIDEFFFVRLSNAVNAVIADGEAIGTIVNDDANPDRNVLRVWRPSNGTWYSRNYASNVNSTAQWGLSTDVPVPADFNGDGKIDMAVWRPAEGKWYININGVSQVRQWGLNGDIPVPADYNGDGRADLAVYRPSNRTWWLRDFNTGRDILVGAVFGETGDLPVPADYNGDGRADLAVYRRSNGTWWVMDAVNFGSWIHTGAVAANQRNGNDVPVPGDFDGDGLADLAVWNNADGKWKIRRSSDGAMTTMQWGLPNDFPQSNDFDGDGRTDLAVWRPSSGEWFIIESRTGNRLQMQWGLPGDWSAYDRSRYGRKVIWRWA